MKHRSIVLSLALFGCVIIGLGIAFAFLARHANSSSTTGSLPGISPATTAVPGLSISGASPCQDFLAETQPGVSAIVPQNGAITEQAVRAYAATSLSSSGPGTVSDIWYFDCQRRTFYYVELTGRFFPQSSPPGVTIPPAAHEYLLFDAKSGNLLRISLGN